MKILPISENQKHIAKTSLAAGTAAAAASVLNLPKETKKMLMSGKDNYVKHIQDVIKSTEKSDMDFIQLNAVKERAGRYFAETKKNTIKSAGQSFAAASVTAAAGLAVGSFLADKVVDKINKKANKEVQQKQ